MSGQGSGGNVIAAICNFFIPGLGHLVHVGVSYALAATVVLAIIFWPLGVILHIISIISAARYSGRSALWCAQY